MLEKSGQGFLHSIGMETGRHRFTPRSCEKHVSKRDSGSGSGSGSGGGDGKEKSGGNVGENNDSDFLSASTHSIEFTKKDVQRITARFEQLMEAQRLFRQNQEMMSRHRSGSM